MAVAIPPPPKPAANPLQPPPLPPGVYFSPTRDESVGILNRWIAGEPLHDTLGFVFVEDIYGSGPEELRRRYPPACVRGRKHSWWFLSQTKFQSSKQPPSGVRRRADRRVATGGYWRLEQSRKEIPVAGGVKNCFGFYLGPPGGGKRNKTPWLVEEFTSALDDGTGKGGVPALYRLYVTPRASNDDVRGIFGEDGIECVRGVKRPMRVVVPAHLFDAVAGLLPPGRVRYRAPAQQHPPPPPPPPPAALLDYEQQGQFFSGAGVLPGQYDYEQQFWGVAPPSEGVLLGQYDQQFWGFRPPPPPPPASPDLFHEVPAGDHGLYGEQFFSENAPPPPPPPPTSPGPFHEIPAGGLEQHDDQMFSGTAPPPPPPPESPGLYLEISGDNMSVTMDELLQLIDEKPAEEAEKPAEEAEADQEWDSFVTIVDDFERFSQND
ncbi:cleavage and polyadenylation specificity factor subunit 6-like [Brachypodium distachyon]|nr:cleavage and polyadenylation specificity factor subunit 6-like [Brachypodium distachyon]|eukprot:XP_024310931.1 cleavage and polyadenylation specificity factor subunit 6-like [Brachypodium distachyon]